ncbi:MAG: hypothetical protein ACK5RE_05330 [Pseudanabaena sp.]|jgi:hypothetical protein
MRIISNFRKYFLNPENHYSPRLLGLWARIADFQQWFVDFQQVEVSFG